KRSPPPSVPLLEMVTAVTGPLDDGAAVAGIRRLGVQARAGTHVRDVRVGVAVRVELAAAVDRPSLVRVGRVARTLDDGSAVGHGAAALRPPPGGCRVGRRPPPATAGTGRCCCRPTG